MSKLTGKERISRILDRQPVDRIGCDETFWADTRRLWHEQGHVPPCEQKDWNSHFGLDVRSSWGFNLVADLDFEPQILEETEETKLVRDGNYTIQRWWKAKNGTQEHVDFDIQDRDSWEKLARPHLVNPENDRRRIHFDNYRTQKALAEKYGEFFFWRGVNVFECMHPVCGHEYMLMGMAMDPDWVKDMCEVYSDLIIRLMKICFEEEGRPDGIYFFEDMGFKNRPFMSPAMYRDIIQPAHAKTFQYAHSIGCKVVVHSCGFVEPLVPGLIEAGMDCLQAMEIKAGMDPLRLKQQYGDQISLFGGLDIRVLETNDLAKVDELLETMIPSLMVDGGYILHTDHSIPPSVKYETYRHFLQRGLEIGTYREKTDCGE